MILRPALEPTQPPVQWMKRPGFEADHSSPSCVEVKKALSYSYTPLIRLHGVKLKGKVVTVLFLTEHRALKASSPSFFPNGTRVSFPGGKVARV
jgi:hypothetical protein